MSLLNLLRQFTPLIVMTGMSFLQITQLIDRHDKARRQKSLKELRNLAKSPEYLALILDLRTMNVLKRITIAMAGICSSKVVILDRTNEMLSSHAVILENGDLMLTEMVCRRQQITFIRADRGVRCVDGQSAANL
jgi:hypothetical protein